MKESELYRNMIQWKLRSTSQEKIENGLAYWNCPDLQILHSKDQLNSEIRMHMVQKAIMLDPQEGGEKILFYDGIYNQKSGICQFLGAHTHTFTAPNPTNYFDLFLLDDQNRSWKPYFRVQSQGHGWLSHMI